MDSTNKVIPGVKVVVRNTETDIAHTMMSNQEGNFAIPELPAGPYVIEASSTGFETYRQTGIVLETGQTLDIEVKMVVGSVSVSVEITADVANLNTDNGPVKGDVLVYQEIQDMPLNGRDFTELALYCAQAWLPHRGQGGSFASINGARVRCHQLPDRRFRRPQRARRGRATAGRWTYRRQQEFKIGG